jgi:hypothetical protein
VHLSKESYVDWKESVIDAANIAACK